MVGSGEEYADAVAAVLRGTATAVPVLHQSALPSPEGAVRRAQEAAAGRVVGFGDQEWAAAARLHAWLDGRGFEWFDDVDALVAAAGAGRDPLTVCAPPELLTRTVQDAITAATSFRVLHAEVAEVDFPVRAVSFLTAWSSRTPSTGTSWSSGRWACSPSG
jgi:MoxR-like ATPase